MIAVLVVLAVIVWVLVAIALALVVGIGIADAERRTSSKPCCPHDVDQLGVEPVRGEFRAVVIPLDQPRSRQRDSRGTRLDVRA